MDGWSWLPVPKHSGAELKSHIPKTHTKTTLASFRWSCWGLTRERNVQQVNRWVFNKLWYQLSYTGGWHHHYNKNTALQIKTKWSTDCFTSNTHLIAPVGLTQNLLKFYPHNYYTTYKNSQRRHHILVVSKYCKWFAISKLYILRKVMYIHSFF